MCGGSGINEHDISLISVASHAEQTQSHERDDSLLLAHPSVPATEEGGMLDSAEMESGGGVGGCGQSGSDEGDKYLYLRRGFTSEIFKIEIQNIPKYIGYTVRIKNGFTWIREH